MGDMGFGYGSQWHLLRYLGYHRMALEHYLKEKMRDVREIEWLDHRFHPKAELRDVELKGVEFLLNDEPQKAEWAGFWPRKGNPPNWDAVALVTLKNRDITWMFVEAKSHVDELGSRCNAVERGGLSEIKKVFAKTQMAFGVTDQRDWTQGYYQHANRLALIYFFSLLDSPPARLLNIYFTGDNVPKRKCPKSETEWKPVISRRDQQMGLLHESELNNRVYSLFLPVCGQNVDYNGRPL